MVKLLKFLLKEDFSRSLEELQLSHKAEKAVKYFLKPKKDHLYVPYGLELFDVSNTHEVKNGLL